MDSQNINSIKTDLRAFPSPASARKSQNPQTDFKSILDSRASASQDTGLASNPSLPAAGREIASGTPLQVNRRAEALAAYRNQVDHAEEKNVNREYGNSRSPASPESVPSSLAGLEKDVSVITEKKSFLSRVGKGISNAIKGIKNFFRRLFAGPEAAKHEKNAGLVETKTLQTKTDWEKYSDDQLLSNPGGDHYYLKQNTVHSHPPDQQSFLGRIGKDISDALANVKNSFQNFFFGARIRYRDKSNQIQEAEQRGFLGSVLDSVKDIASAVSFGLWRPDGEQKPQGIGQRLNFFFSKMREAILGDLVQGATGSLIHMGEDLILAGWNLVEVLPDATIGNFSTGRKLTTTIFDNGQVVIDYLTDILPTGEAWLRVHAMNLGGANGLKPPVIYNIRMPERSTEDVRWQYVRNTPLRKKIETVGSLLADILTVKWISETEFSSDEEHHQ